MAIVQNVLRIKEISNYLSEKGGSEEITKNGKGKRKLYKENKTGLYEMKWKEL